MSESELRQAVVFAVRFELYTQRFRHASTRQPIDRLVPMGELIPDGWEPIENPARVREYWADVLPPGTKPYDYPLHWCGALCLFAMHRAELGLDVFWKGGFASRVLDQLDTGEAPEPGDVAYFHRHQHHAIVESVDALRSTVTTIDGNQSPGIVRRVRPLASAAAYYSIQPLIDAKGAA